MALNKAEKMLIEGIDSMLQQDAKLGLSFHDQDAPENKQDWRGYQYLHEQINDMFMLKAADLTHFEGINSAFRKVHNYKYVDDWTFLPAMDKEMVSQGVPREERIKALEFVPKIIEELRSEHHMWAERDGGLNPKIDEIRKVSKPKQKGKFKIHNAPINKRNVDKPKHGDGSPAHTSQGKPPMPDDSHDNDDVDPR
jgi:hypothetical protein